MNILVFSDTHGELKRALELYEQIASFAKIDVIVHCGDMYSDAKELGEILQKEIVRVPGNCDGCRERAYKVIDIPSGKMLVTHGHMESVKHSMLPLLYLAEENGCNVVCYGHTHIPQNEQIGDIRVINPGSTSRPRDGGNGSCAFICASEDSVVATIIK